MRQGRFHFMVIEGLDGSGKSTQIERLLKYLDQEGINHRYLHFPRTEEGYYGELIARFLRGDLGPLESVHPYLVALIYAGNRNDARELIASWLAEGITVVADRYVVSNIAFQCAKLDTAKEREALRDWILKFEYEYHKIPRPDVNIFLDVPFKFTRQKLKGERRGEDRDYLNGKADIHEQDLDFQNKVRQVYLELSVTEPTLQVIKCSDNRGEMLSPDEIFTSIQHLLFPAGA
ncbi:MAG: thymidylate kinase [Bacteroides sp. SM1_62]|nr:MAG: thymidylate kinase [Bacteroides sp. SM23_62]KPL26050.1 MAG: thymidylate kinase [Bacteroides sp. SM1_62]